MTEPNGDTVRKWLPVLLVGFGLAVSWGSFQTQLNVMAEEITELKQEDSANSARDGDSSAQVTELKANQRAIKEDVEEIKKEQKEFKKETNEKLDKILDELRRQ